MHRGWLLLIVIDAIAVPAALGQNNGPFQTTNANDILQQFKNQTILWTTNIWVYANGLFGILAVIEFAWDCDRDAPRKDGPPELDIGLDSKTDVDWRFLRAAG
jgi:hypothetical protein